MACEPNDLASLSRCFCGLSQDRLLEIQTYLLCQIMLNGGTGGGGVGAQEVFSGSGSPVGVVTPAATVTAALYINTDTGELWQWYGTPASWH